MGCLQSKQEDKSGSMGSMTAIGRTERMIQHRQNPPSKQGSNSNEATNDLKNQLKQSIRDRASDNASASGSSLKNPDLDATGRLMPGEVASRRKTSVKTHFTTIMDGKITIEYAVCSQRGYYPDDPHKPNQDSFSITNNFTSIPDDSFFGVYDGHGPVGEHFAQYTKHNLPSLLAKYVQQERVKAHKARNALLPKDKQFPFNPKLFPMLESKSYELASKRAHEDCNQKMIDTQPLVNLSGSTAITAGFHNGQAIISCVGDSRAILGYKEEDTQKIIAVPLSQDQTPWRKDERERIKRAGGRVMTIDEMEGKSSINSKEMKKDEDRKLGEDNFIDEEGDPPRVWLSDKKLPGTSFTRSLGDQIANTVGVFAEPEFFSKTITDEDAILVLASDGVFEFLQNQEIIDICAKSANPVEACSAVVDVAYNKWLEYENRTDDITAIIMFFRHGEDGK